MLLILKAVVDRRVPLSFAYNRLARRTSRPLYWRHLNFLSRRACADGLVNLEPAVHHKNPFTGSV